MLSPSPPDAQPGPEAQRFYRQALDVLKEAGPPFLIGGAYALRHHTGVARHTKDLDVFVRPQDWERTLEVLAGAGFRTEITYPHWLGKAFQGEEFVDVIFNSGNGIAPVDDGWFEHAVAGELFGVPVQICPVEETLWSKAFTMERDRYDGADVAHLLQACGPWLDWQRLLKRFGGHWRVLLSHLVLFGYVYPGERSLIPGWIMDALLQRLQNEEQRPPPAARVCQGTLLSGGQYLVDVEHRGYQDGRLWPHGSLTPEQLARWRAALQEQG